MNSVQDIKQCSDYLERMFLEGLLVKAFVLRFERYDGEVGGCKQLNMAYMKPYEE